MRRFMIAIALTCVFSAPTLAGDVPVVPAPPPPTAPTQMTGIATEIILTIIGLAK